MNFKDLQKERRSIYALGQNTDLPQEDIVSQIREVAQEIPTAFNSQTSRHIVLFGEANQKFWQLIHDVQKDILDEDTWAMMGPIIEGSKDALGTVLFFEDLDAVKNGIPANEIRQKAYKENNSANAQYAIWLALTELGLGSSLQHFNVGYDEGYDGAVRELFDLPDSYELLAQMPFGSIEQEAGEKEYIDTEVQVQVYDK